MSNDRRIKSLKTRQKSLLTSFGLIKAFVDGYQEETGAREVAVRLEHLVAIWNDFNAMQAELETLDEAAIEAHLKERVEFETSYFRVKGFLLAVNKTEPTSPRTSSSSSSTTQSPLSSHVRLPDIKLPVFTGNLDQWLNFHDLFVSLVHSSHELSNIQKFYYLRSSLSGDALKLVQTIALSANNYQVAWNLLLDHYQNPVRLKQSYVDSLFEFPSVKKESASELHSLVEKFEANVKVLHQLGEKTEFWDILLIRMLSIRLDPTTRRDWEEHASTLNAVSFQNLTSFIQRRVAVLQTIGKLTESPSPTNFTKKPVQRVVASHGASQVNVGRKCICCSDHHPLYMCTTFAKFDLEEKEREVHQHQLCRNCLRKGHHARDCSSSSFCRKCRGRHHTLLCSEENSVAANSRTTEFSQPEAPTTSTSGEQPKASTSATIRDPVSYASTGQAQHAVLLATAVVKLVDDSGTVHVARALLDSGSECCFITESFSHLIKTQRKKISVPISGIGQSSTNAQYKIVSTISSRVGNYSTSVEFLVLPKVTIDLPTASFNVTSWQIPPGIHLADPSFHEAKQIDIVIGAEIFFELFKVPGRIPLGDSLPTLVNSVLGWIVSGKASHGTPTKPVVSNVALVADQHRCIEQFCTTEEDATPSSSVDQTSRNERTIRTAGSNDEVQCIAHIPLKKVDAIDTLLEAESLLPTIYLPASEPSSIDLHIDRFTNYDRTLRTSIINLGTAYVTSERSRSISSTPRLCWFHSFLRQPIHVGGQLNQTSKTFNYDHQYILSALPARYWFTVARKQARLNVNNSIALVNSRDKLLQQSMIKLTASCDTVTEPSSKIVVGHWGLTWILPTNHQATPSNTSALFFLCYSTHIAYFKLISLLSATNFLQRQHHYASRREPIGKTFSENDCNFITATTESLGLSLCRKYELAGTRYCTNYDVQRQSNPPGTFYLHGRTVALRSTQRYFVRVLGFLIQPQNGVKRRLVQIECCVNFLYIVPITSESLILDHYRLELLLTTIPDIDIPEKQNQLKLIWILWDANAFVRSKWCDCPIVIHRRLIAEADVFARVTYSGHSHIVWFLESDVETLPASNLVHASKPSANSVHQNHRSPKDPSLQLRKTSASANTRNRINTKHRYFAQPRQIQPVPPVCRCYRWFSSDDHLK